MSEGRVCPMCRGRREIAIRETAAQRQEKYEAALSAGQHWRAMYISLTIDTITSFPCDVCDGKGRV